MLKKSLDQAVIEASTVLTEFSAHDITDIIRSEVNRGNYLVDGFSETENLAQFIDHFHVREMVIALFNNGLYTRTHNGSYFVYSHVPLKQFIDPNANNASKSCCGNCTCSKTSDTVAQPTAVKPTLDDVKNELQQNGLFFSTFEVTDSFKNMGFDEIDIIETSLILEEMLDANGVLDNADIETSDNVQDLY